ncbi:hypothetical protein ACWEN3_28560 [Streptomyces sp. NPDC004561]
MAQQAISQEDDPDTSLEIFILLILGLFMTLFGGLLFGIDSGSLPFNPDSTYGLFLVIISFQAAALGKTPFGDFGRSWLLVIVGFCAATVGLFGCFIPGISSAFLRILVGVLLLCGGIVLSAQLWISKQKARAWLQIGGILRHLTIACGLTYVLMVILGISTLFPGTMANIQTAVILLVFGISIFYLAGCLWRVALLYPAEWQARSVRHAPMGTRTRIFQRAPVPLSQALVILLGILLILLGGLLIPVGAGALPFSPDGQFGVLLTIMAIQTACLGQTPLGQFRRSWLIMAVGAIFAGLGIVAAIVPGVLTDALRTLVGVLNIAGGGALLIKLYIATRSQARSAPATVPAEMRRLGVNQAAQGCAAIAFGVIALVPGLIPGLIVPVILIIYGLLLIEMVSLLSKVAKLSPA